MRKIDPTTFAVYLRDEYGRRYDKKPTMTHLHKLFYFFQRESFIRHGQPMIYCAFWAWKHGPVVLELNQLKNSLDTVERPIDRRFLSEHKALLEKCWKSYGRKTAEQLVNLSKGEVSWRTAWSIAQRNSERIRLIENRDIVKDARKIAARRAWFEKRN